MFSDCTNLKSIIFSSTKTIQPNYIGYMFMNCNYLTSVDLSNFDTSICTGMEFLFDNCYELEVVDLSSFNTSNCKSFRNMFSFCKKIQVLDLSNFETQSVIDMSFMIGYNYALTYINLKNFSIKSDTNIICMFSGMASFTIICYGNDASILETKFPELNVNCSDTCFSENIKLINEANRCVEDCNTDDNEYKYEYKNKCYSSCPSGTTPSSTNHYLCLQILVCPKYYNMDKTECFDEIKDGYFLSDEENNLLDKCHEDCKTCNKKEIEGNTNCLTCNNDYFFDNGNCLQSCEYGSYIDESGKKVCNCNEKCKECSENSNLCKSCREGYYSKNSENFPFECYNELEKYYLKDNYFYECYSSCKKCLGEGIDDNHNCEECIDNYNFTNEINKEKNCYPKCNN